MFFFCLFSPIIYYLVLLAILFDKMIYHIVLMCFKDSISEGSVCVIMEAIRNLQTKIPQIASYSEGFNCSTENLAKGFTHGFTIQFKSVADRDAYLVHADHVVVAKQIIEPNLKNGLESVLVFDYEAPN
jgi:hypothetical protein